MAKFDLDSLIEWLKSNPQNRFEIYDVDKQKAVTKCISYQDMVSRYGSAMGYFESLADDGVKAVQIQKKRKNGSAYVREGCGLNFALDIDDNVAASGSQAKPAATQQPSKTNMDFGGLGSPSTFGLGLPEIMDMRSNADRFKETKEAYEELKKEFKELQLENKRLENENLRHQIGVESKPSAVDKLVEGIANNPQALPQIIASFKSSGNTPGLNSPQPEQPKLSDTKSTVIDFISNPQINDEQVTLAYYALLEAAKGNQSFLKAYHKLLTKFDLIQYGSDDSNNG